MTEKLDLEIVVDEYEASVKDGRIVLKLTGMTETEFVQAAHEVNDLKGLFGMFEVDEIIEAVGLDRIIKGSYADEILDLLDPEDVRRLVPYDIKDLQKIEDEIKELVAEKRASISDALEDLERQGQAIIIDRSAGMCSRIWRAMRGK